MRMLAHIARRYDRGYGHFTTRQNIQFNWFRLEDAPDALADLASVQMHALQTSGNVIRNTTADQWAGVALDEIEVLTMNRNPAKAFQWFGLKKA
jgi:sulfite reductase (NADPH) hemoprotein beta-component